MKTILIADDEPNVRKVVSRTLSRKYRVIEAADGEEAVDLAVRKNPDLILMDMMMPRLDGLSACFTLKSHGRTKNIPVLILTAVAAESNKQLATQVWGADRYWTKPFEPQDLLNTVGECIERN